MSLDVQSIAATDRESVPPAALGAVRFRIVALLAAFTLVASVLRMNISVADCNSFMKKDLVW